MREDNFGLKVMGNQVIGGGSSNREEKSFKVSVCDEGKGV